MLHVDDRVVVLDDAPERFSRYRGQTGTVLDVRDNGIADVDIFDPVKGDYVERVIPVKYLVPGHADDQERMVEVAVGLIDGTWQSRTVVVPDDKPSAEIADYVEQELIRTAHEDDPDIAFVTVLDYRSFQQ